MAKQLFSYESLVHALSGVCGSCTAMAIVLPLDTVRTRLILDKHRWDKFARLSQKIFSKCLTFLKEILFSPPIPPLKNFFPPGPIPLSKD